LKSRFNHLLFFLIIQEILFNNPILQTYISGFVIRENNWLLLKTKSNTKELKLEIKN